MAADHVRGRRLVIALGGNAIIPAGQEGTYEQQAAITRATMKQVARLAADGQHGLSAVGAQAGPGWHTHANAYVTVTHPNSAGYRRNTAANTHNLTANPYAHSNPNINPRPRSNTTTYSNATSHKHPASPSNR